jgi:acetate kinase
MPLCTMGKYKNVLTINGGSSSIKYAVYRMEDNPVCLLYGKIDRIGLSDPVLTAAKNNKKEQYPAVAPGIREAAGFLVDWLEKQEEFNDVTAIGHRIVHGMDHTEAVVITQPLLDELKKISSYDPDHLPGEIQLIEVFSQRHPQLQQVACFDTSFHTTIPRVARMFPLPRRFDDAGIKRYGFHGLSYSYIMEELVKLNATAVNGRVIIAHLGNGASMAAVKEGKSIDTSMGFTPAGGFMMGTRPGDLDPGVAWYIMQKEAMTTEQFNDLINHQSGLVGVSESSPDMQDLLKKESTDIKAKEAVDLFCYQVKKWIGSFTAVLGGLDALVFTGGIGENAAGVRSRICAGLQFMGIAIDELENEKNAIGIAVAGGKIPVYVIPTNEELIIAKTTIKLHYLYGSERNK